MRPEDKNARRVQQAFANGATLAELEQHLAFLRSLGAPDDAHPRVGVNEDYEVTMMICVVERPTAQASTTFNGRPGALASGPPGRALAACELVRAVDEACAEQAHAPRDAAPLPRLAQQAAAAARLEHGKLQMAGRLERMAPSIPAPSTGPSARRLMTSSNTPGGSGCG